MSPGVKVALVPGVPALLPGYAGRVDPVAELRAACVAAVEWLGEDVTVVADPQGLRVAEALGVSPGLGDARRQGSSLLDQRGGAADVDLRGGGLDGGFETVASATSSTNVGATSSTNVGATSSTNVGATSSTNVGASSVLVVANGSARRSEKAPGHLDERAAAYDSELEKALRAGDVGALRALDPGLAEELMVGNVAGFARLGELLSPGLAPEVDYADDPFGVQYWVMRWSLPA
ncbi:class III extradiol ring-cleavage dioxygenase family protein [Nocardioides salarius]|nr:hypothetical protein [Nocardioides salarius]